MLMGMDTISGSTNAVLRALVAVVCCCYVPAANGEAFTALVHMTKALVAERELAGGLRTYVAAERQRLDSLERIAVEYETHAEEALVDAEEYLSNPVNAFLFVKKFYEDYESVQKKVVDPTNEEEYLDLYKSVKAYLPDEEDFQGATDALLRLQDTYSLPPYKIAEGTFIPDYSSPLLTANDCFSIGSVAYKAKNWHHCLSWMDEALSQWYSESNKTVSKGTVLDYLAYTASMQGNHKRALVLTNELLEIDPANERYRSNREYFWELLSDEERLSSDIPPLMNERTTDSYRTGVEFKKYEALCRGEDLMPDRKAQKLQCYYKSDHPLLLISPVKVEQLYKSPDLLFFRDLLTDNEISRIKELATPRLKRATVNDPATGKLVYANYRVSKSGWLEDEMDPLIARTSKRIAAIIGLTMDTAEFLQVVNYGIGGQYEPHYDFARKTQPGQPSPTIGNRIATFIFYLSDVVAGGLTVFTEIGAKVYPEKASAAFWYNLHPSGEGDQRTRHAGCPVLAGSKWVANKWIHERGQEFTRPCTLKFQPGI